jgi:hypothetical protein
MHNILTLLEMSLFIVLLLLIILMFPVSVPICSHDSNLIIFTNAFEYEDVRSKGKSSHSNTGTLFP